MHSCGDFQTAGSLRSSQGVISATLDAKVGELCQIFTSTDESVLAEAIGFRDGMSLLLPLEPCENLRVGAPVYGLGRQPRVPAGKGLLGRVIDGLGTPIDGKGPLQCRRSVLANSPAPQPLERSRICEQLVTGVRAIDALIALGRGQRMALMAGSGVGKSTLLGEIAKGSHADINVVALIGERGREVKPFLEDCLGPEGLAKSVVVVATAEQQPLVRVRAMYAALAIAHDFRDAGLDVLLMLDSITRFATSQREIGLLLGEPPTMRGYTPSVFQSMARVLEQMGTSENGSITGLISVLVDGDDFNEPIADCTRSIVDGHIVLDRKLAEHGHFPAINIARSLSRTYREVTDAAMQQAATQVRDSLATYAEVEDLLRIGAYRTGTSFRIDKAVNMKSAIDRFVKQPSGDFTSLDETKRRLGELASQWTDAKS